MRSSRHRLILLVLLGTVVLSLVGLSASAAAPRAPAAPTAARPDGIEERPETAPVVVDGEALFRVRGVSAYSAETRARAIADRIEEAAADAGVPSSALTLVRGERSSDIAMGDHPIMSVFDGDGAVEGIHREDLAQAFATRIRGAVDAYRRERAPRRLLGDAAAALAATVVLVVVVLLLRALGRRLRGALDRRFRRRVESLEAQSHQIVQAERVLATARAALRGLRALLVIALGYLYLSFVLSRFPWTRSTASRLLGYVLTPFSVMGNAVLTYLPNVIFLAVLVWVTRYALKLLSLVAAGLERGTIRVQGFEPEWASPTYRIARLAIVGFAAVVAYPYVPGSETDAFKGVSIFFGVIFSLGASSVVANMLAGYSLIYRRTFKVGDRVKINDVTGDVTELRLQVTHLKTIKNEDVVVPNSAILASQVVNYSAYAAGPGLILHTTVGIGYEVPWRQVEAMLLMAASRTPGLRAEPPPFVAQVSLGDFAVNYVLNVYCGDAHAMERLYTALHRNIQDVFNEYGVQIMTPAYESDPESPKVVPKDHWHDAPAELPTKPKERP
jgi:small-conductance mechanosensitive channel